MTAVKHEPFVWYPRRFSQALWPDKSITYDQWALGTFVRDAADYRTQTLTITITELKALMHRTRRSDDSIRRDLHALKAGWWLDFDVKARQREPWVIRLTGLLVREAEEPSAANSGPSAANSPPSLRQLTAADGLPQNGASAHGESDGDAAELPQAEIGPSTSKALRVGEDYVSKGTPDSDAFQVEEKGVGADKCNTCEGSEFFEHNGRCKACGSEQVATNVGF
jgi:hypothetical protein